MIKKYTLKTTTETFNYTNYYLLRNKLVELLPNVSFPKDEEVLLSDSSIQYIKDTFNIELEYKEELEPVPSLTEVQERKINELTNAKYMEIKSGMLWKTIDGVKYIADADNDAKTAINGQILAFDKGLMESVTWKFQNYLWLDFNKTEFEEFAGTILNWIESKFVKEKTLIEQVKSCTVISDVEEIKW